jgi:CRISPR system Cascade subunit CasD
MSARRHLWLRLEGPLQAWGDVAFDPRRPTCDFPTLSGLAGLCASALGWTYADGERTTALQDAITYGVREDRPPTRLRDYQTVDLGRDAKGWTRWGVEVRSGAFASGTHVLEKLYLADASFLVAMRIADGGPVELDELIRALEHPARPLFLGRKACPPAAVIVAGECSSDAAYAALLAAPWPDSIDEAEGHGTVRLWYPEGDGPKAEPGQRLTVWDRRDFALDRFLGCRRVVARQMARSDLMHSEPEA